MTKQVLYSTVLPLSAEQLDRLQAATGDFSSLQPAWISGYFWRWVAEGQPAGAVAPAQPQRRLRRGADCSAERLADRQRAAAGAEQLRDDLIAAQLDMVLINTGDYKFKQIAQEKLLLVVTSTQSEEVTTGRGDRTV